MKLRDLFFFVYIVLILIYLRCLINIILENIVEIYLEIIFVIECKI